MARKAAAKRRDLRGPSPTRLIEAAAYSVLRDELRGDLFVEAMKEMRTWLIEIFRSNAGLTRSGKARVHERNRRKRSFTLTGSQQ